MDSRPGQSLIPNVQNIVYEDDGGTTTFNDRHNYQLVVCRVLASLVKSPARVFAEQVDNLKRCKSLKVATKATKSSQIKKCSRSNAFGALDTNERIDSAI